MQKIARFGVVLAFIACSLTVTRGTARGWSSTVGASDMGLIRLETVAFATHQFLSQKAYQLLAEHPVIRAGYVRFPDLAAIVLHGSIDQGQNGLGPDNPGNSLYSWHWYNPNLEYEPGSGNGLTPKKVAEYLLGLKNLLMSQGLEGGAMAPSARRGTGPSPSDGAHEAAYLAHFIQDMTCAFHVVGMPVPPTAGPDPIRLYRNDAVKRRMIAGPFRVFTEDMWDDVVGHAAAAFADDGKADWFDPNYYDGAWPADVKNSGHFQYEAAVEVAYMKDVLNHGARWDALLATGLVSPVWKRGVSAEVFTRLVARATQSKYTVTGGALFPPELRAEGRVEVPYDDWWRAIQATYTLWRQAFSALVVLPEDLKLVKLAGERDVYQLHAVVRNLEPEADATDVRLAYEIPGSRDQKGEGRVPKIPLSRASEWIPLSGKVRIADPGIHGDRIVYDGAGTVRLTVTGRYPLPDAEEAIREVPLRDVRIEGRVLPDMTGWTRIEVVDYMSRNGLVLAPREDAGVAETPDQQFAVKEQSPSPRTVVAAGDTVAVSFWGRFKVKVPDITRPAVPLQEAIRMIRAAGLSAKEPFWHVRVDDSVPEGTAVEQSPAPGTLVLPGSGVTFKVAVHRPVTYPAPPAPLDCFASIDIEPQNPRVTVGQSIKLRASVSFYDPPNGRDKLEIPLDQAHFVWDLVSQDKEDWPAGEVVLMSAAGPEATLTPVAAGLVLVSCRIANVLNQNLATNRVLVVERTPGDEPPAEPPPAAPPAGTAPPTEPERPPVKPEIARDPVSPVEESTELEGSWDTSSDMIVDFRRVGGNDYEGTLTQLLTAKKLRFYKELLGQVVFRATRIGPGTYSMSARNGVDPRTGAVIWVYDYAVVTVRGNIAQVNKGLAWRRLTN